MRKMTPFLCFLAFSLGFGWNSPVAGRDEPESTGGEIWVEAYEFTYRADGTPTKEQSYGKATVGWDIEFSRDAQKSQVRFARRIVPSVGGASLVAHTSFQPDRSVLFRMEWREKGRLTRTEDVISREFSSVTRTFLVEPDTGLRRVVQFSVRPAEPSESPAEAQYVDRMKLDPGAIAGPLLRDAKLVALIPGFGFGFEKIYVNLPGTGFFQFSLHPFTGAEPAGNLEGAVLTFDWRGQKYQWFLGKSPLPGGPWSVFVKATDGVPPEYRDAIKPEFAGEIVVGGSNSLR